MSQEKETEMAGKIKSMIAQQFGKSADEIELEMSFIDDLGADSLDLVELVMSIEDEFGIEILDEDVEKIATVQDAIDFISKEN
ncbi:MAG: acyl carrier protein [Candidatus Dadabacteria bacterium]|nr:acyl carrier protein [Candidatus Dadabacteria bacterium]MCY4043045.1 acyl carrier protein [Candidatus Dadabacteria bacterium]MCY4047284.1 acyl carrier protein [Candidatus Dadabacteria bacterium]